MLETPFPFFICKKPGEIPIFGTFLAKKLIFVFFNLGLFSLKIRFLSPAMKTSLWRHTLTDFHDFGINGKKRPYPIPWYQTIILWAPQVQVHEGVVTTPLGKPCYKKRLAGRGLIMEPLGLTCYMILKLYPYRVLSCIQVLSFGKKYTILKSIAKKRYTRKVRNYSKYLNSILVSFP